MSSFAASCSICCHPASCASATSDSLPTATALLCCRCAFDSSATQRTWLLRQHHHPPIRLTHSGAAQSAVELCTSSNGSPPPNSCFAPHLNQTDALHEALSTSSPSARASAHTPTPCLFQPKPLGSQPLQRPQKASASQHAAPSGPSVIQHCPTHPVPDPSAPVQTDSKYIGLPEGGFLQVAVSERPPLRPRSRVLLPDGRSRYSTKTYRYESARAKSQTDLLSVESASVFVLSNCRGVTDTPPFRTTAVSEGSRFLLAPLRMLSQ